MAILVKICGLSTPASVEAAVSAGADMVGFVFFPPSPRYVSPQTAAALAEPARGHVQIVALTVDATNATLSEIVGALRPDILQLHGHEVPERLTELRSMFGLPLMKAIGVSSQDDLGILPAYAQADRFLLDAKPRPESALPGGNGLPFDWRALRGLDAGAPIMLSGGLDPQNVGGAIRIAQPQGVDVSSGVERAPGIKDVAKIKAFIHAARAASG
jgi:phosphoribosylanthranilate isomerase